MKPSLTARLVLSLGLLALAGTNAKADSIRWTFESSVQPTFVSADAGGVGKIDLEPNPGPGRAHYVSGLRFLVGTTLVPSSTAPASQPDHFTNKAYSLSLWVKDYDTQASNTLIFRGVLNGTLSATTADITNTFTGPTVQTLTLGIHLFTVTIGPYVPPGSPGSHDPGRIKAFVVPTRERPHTTPEPSTLVLAGLGLMVLGLTAWRKKMRMPCWT